MITSLIVIQSHATGCRCQNFQRRTNNESNHNTPWYIMYADEKKRTEWARGPEIGTLPCLRCRVLGKQQNKGNFIGRTISNCRLHNV